MKKNIFYDDGNPLIEKNGVWYEEGAKSPYSAQHEAEIIYEGIPAVFSGKYEEGREQGIWKVIDEAGSILLTLEFQRGVLEGSTLQYHKSGCLAVLGFYKDNKAEGEWLHFDEHGKMIKKIWYIKDKIVH